MVGALCSSRGGLDFSPAEGCSRLRMGFRVCVRTPEFGKPKGAPQIPPLRYPGFPVELGGVGALHAPFPYRKAHTRPCPVQRGRKSGYAPVGMTILFGNAKYRFQDELSSRAKPRDLRCASRASQILRLNAAFPAQTHSVRKL